MKSINKQRGNVLFLILIAVALFAALSYAVTQSSRGGGNSNNEKLSITASQIFQFFTSVNTAVIRMSVRGVALDNISFDENDVTTNGVFSPSGGGVPWLSLPQNIGNATDWGFGSIEDPALGFYVTDVGSNTNITGREAFGGLADISLELCEAINDKLGLANPPQANSFTFGAVNTYSVNNNVLDAYPGAHSACIHTDAGTGAYLYYHVIIEQ